MTWRATADKIKKEGLKCSPYEGHPTGFSCISFFYPPTEIAHIMQFYRDKENTSYILADLTDRGCFVSDLYLEEEWDKYTRVMEPYNDPIELFQSKRKWKQWNEAEVSCNGNIEPERIIASVSGKEMEEIVKECGDDAICIVGKMIEKSD